MVAVETAQAGQENRAEQGKIGLEIHGYIHVPSNAKLFCNCSLLPGEPNTHICPVCTGQPGSKPMPPNSEAVEAILKIALFLNCKTINPLLLWQRKHYSWPDLPNGYQKTMSGAYSQPVGLDGEFLGIGIEEVHLEEDPARWDPVNGGVDYNRCGYPLVEIVTKPDFTSSEQVREWIENLMVALSYIKAVRRDLGIKCDVNVSIAPSYVRTEVKNVNSFSGIVGAIEYELKRQQLEPAQQQTRAWDEASGTTRFMRSKETAQEYMFIPDPDLPLIEITDEWKDALKALLPDRPDVKQHKFEALNVSADAARKLSSNLALASEAELDMAAVNEVPAEFIANRYLNEITGALAARAAVQNDDSWMEQRSVRQQLIRAFHKRTITNLVFKELLSDLVHGDTETITSTLASFESSRIGDEQLLALVKEAIAARPEAAADARAGKEKAINAIVGYVMGKTKGAADPAVIQALVKDNL
jgi:aspartyl-tRNA(Asn)/glutamyl-tRNA(Gln) amidotransferase subunit B